MTDVLNFPFEMPIAYQKELAVAELDDASAVEEVNEKYKYDLSTVRNFGGVFSFKQKKVNIERSTTEWLSKLSGGYYKDDYKVTITTTADSVRIDGSANGSITLDLKLGAGGLLTGTATYDNKGPFPVIAELL